jgi:hypothetical protein
VHAAQGNIVASPFLQLFTSAESWEAHTPDVVAGSGGSGFGWGGGVVPQQSQAQGGQVWPATQAGQAQAQPVPPPPPPGGFIWVQAPVGHGVVMHWIPSSIQPQPSAVSAAHDLTSLCAAQGSGGGSGCCWQTPETHS